MMLAVIVLAVSISSFVLGMVFERLRCTCPVSFVDMLTGKRCPVHKRATTAFLSSDDMHCPRPLADGTCGCSH